MRLKTDRTAAKPNLIPNRTQNYLPTACIPLLPHFAHNRLFVTLLRRAASRSPLYCIARSRRLPNAHAPPFLLPPFLLPYNPRLLLLKSLERLSPTLIGPQSRSTADQEDAAGQRQASRSAAGDCRASLTCSDKSASQTATSHIPRLRHRLKLQRCRS